MLNFVVLMQLWWFFIFYRHGKCTSQPVGVNTSGSISKMIATKLGLKNSEEYTEHCFTRSSATILVELGADMQMFKRHGGWKSSSTAEKSLANKGQIAKKITGSNTDLTIRNSNLKNSITSAFISR